MAISVNERMKKSTDKKREQGLRPLQIWLPDTRKANFKIEAKKQSAQLYKDKNEIEVNNWIIQAQDVDEWN